MLNNEKTHDKRVLSVILQYKNLSKSMNLGNMTLDIMASMMKDVRT